MKNILYLVLFLTSLSAISQEKAIEITNRDNGKTRLFIENQRLKIRTLDEKKHIGRLHFSDNQTILIDNQPIKVDSIQSIKRQPAVLGTLKTVVLIAGLATVSASLAAAKNGENNAFLLFIYGSSTTISAGLMESINPNRSNRNWTFKIIEK
mgnify:CR=1 FL=1